MPLTNVSPFSFVREQFLFDGTNSPAAFTFSSNGYAIACIVALAPGERIDEIGLWSEAASGSFDVVVALEGMSSSVQGNPSGTLPGIDTQDAKSTTLHAADFAPGMRWIPINPYRNGSDDTEILAVTVRRTGGGVGSLLLRTQIESLQTAARFPFVVTRAAASGDFSGGTGGIPFVAARDDLGRFVAGTSALYDQTSTGSDSSLTSDRLIGNKWTVGYSCRVSAICFRYLPVTNTTTNFAVQVYVNDEVKATQTVNSLAIDAVGASSLSELSFVTLPIAPLELDAGDVVRLVIKGNTSDAVTLSVFEFASEEDRLSYAGGESMHRCYGSTTPVWVDTPTESLACIFPIIDQVNFAAGLGGSPGGGIQRSVVYKNVDDQWVFFRLVDRTGVPINGALAESFSIALNAACSGLEPEEPAEPTNDPVFFADGVYGLQLTQEESDFDTIVLTAQHANGSVAPVIIETSPQVPEVTIQPDSLTLQN